MPDRPTAMISMRLRCQELVDPETGGRCGGCARWVSPDLPYQPARLLCDRHAGPGCQRVTAGQVFRRVRVIVAVDLAAAADIPATSCSEAVNLIQGCLAKLGAVTNVLGVTSCLVNNGAPQGLRMAKAGGGVGR